MKKELFLIFTFILIAFTFSFVKAAEPIDVNSLPNVINNGDITNNLNFKEVDEFAFNAKYENSQLTIEYRVDFKTKKEDLTALGTINLVLDPETNHLKAELETNKKNNDYIYLEKIFSLIPLWAVEASPSYQEIKKYIPENSEIQTLKGIFNKCYLEQMGVCYTNVTKFDKVTLKADIELSSKAPAYALEKLEEQKNNEKQKDYYTKVGIVIAILVVLILLLKLFQPKKKKIKY